MEKEEKKSGKTITVIPDEVVMDIDGLSAFIKMDKPTIYAMTSARKIPHSKPTGKLLFLRSRIIKWLLEHELATETQIQQMTNGEEEK